VPHDCVEALGQLGGWTPLGRKGPDGLRRRTPVNPVNNMIDNVGGA
jgi:hypothetical protein